MATLTTQPAIAHGIARLNPSQGLAQSRFRWGPKWKLPPAREGQWVIDVIYNKAIRVELIETVPEYANEVTAWDILGAARDALSAEDEKRRDEWLGYADKREADAFGRQWTARKRREHGDIPAFPSGTYVRRHYSQGVWHIATGRMEPTYRDPDRLDVLTECGQADVQVDLGSTDNRSADTTTDPEGRACRRCLARTGVEPDAMALDRQAAADGFAPVVMG